MNQKSENTWGPHQDQPVLTAGAPLKRARAAVLLLHGRGASAEDILGLADEFTFSDVAYLAPQASGYSWYPHSFLAPLSQNEPALSSALQAVADVFGRIEEAGVPPERIVLLGFSQGACLALEYAARNPRRFGGVVGLSGGLIGPEGTPRDYAGDLQETPVFLGCSDVDPHIPVSRVHETGRVLEGMNAVVTERIYPGMGHTVNSDEVAFVADLVSTL
ncbi:MAG TPA: alpha/beta fold hydrolase [Rhodothermales bacterium]|nr:alpha/beta fold hydrolase [Rhodothermales bacterium]